MKKKAAEPACKNKITMQLKFFDFLKEVQEVGLLKELAIYLNYSASTIERLAYCDSSAVPSARMCIDSLELSVSDWKSILSKINPKPRAFAFSKEHKHAFLLLLREKCKSMETGNGVDCSGCPFNDLNCTLHSAIRPCDWSNRQIKQLAGLIG